LSHTSKKTLILLTGPTASGKTATGIWLAKHFQTEIISADSRQCFRELNIGVARPSPEQLQEVPHHFIATHSVKEEVTAITFEQYALHKTASLFRDHDYVVMVGGTGLYIKAFCEGLDEIPAVDPAIRERITSNYESQGLRWLQEQVRQKDPAFYEAGEIQNPQRLMRALEVAESTGKSILSFRNKPKTPRDFRIIKLGLDVPKETLHQNIHDRVERMMEAGLLEEVRSLLPYRHLNALQTVGYTELFDFFDNKITLATAVERIKTNTRQYAKRQLTWFRKDDQIRWVLPGEVENGKWKVENAK
jgi:tRNA dimethylallyltransferase